MPREFSFAWDFGYYLVIGIIAAGLSLFWEMVIPRAGWMLPGGETGSPIVDFLLSPLFLLVGLFLVTGIFHLFLKIFGAAKHGFETTARVVCFSIGPMLFEVVPFLGGAVAGVWSLVMTVIGFREGHETTTGRAVAAVLVPLFFLLLLLGLLIIAGLLVGATQLSV